MRVEACDAARAVVPPFVTSWNAAGMCGDRVAAIFLCRPFQLKVTVAEGLDAAGLQAFRIRPINMRQRAAFLSVSAGRRRERLYSGVTRR